MDVTHSVHHGRRIANRCACTHTGDARVICIGEPFLHHDDRPPLTHLRIENFSQTRQIMSAIVVTLIVLVLLAALSNRPGLNFYARSMGGSGR